MIEQFQQSGHPVFRGISALNRGTLKRKPGRSIIHFKADSGDIESVLRTIHSANELSIYGAVLSWCIDLAETMRGQTSAGVDRSISKENDQLSKQLDPQEVGSLARNQPQTPGAAGNCCRDHLQRLEMMNPDEQLQTVCEQAGFIRPVSEGMYYRTGVNVNDRFGNLIASCREKHYLGLIEILKSNFGFKSIQRSVQFVMSKSSAIMAGMDLKSKSTLHLETTPLFGGHIQRPKSLRG